MPHKFEVVYNSDLIIRDSGEAATLCLFYDRVYLPHIKDPRRVVSASVTDDSRVLRTTFHAPDMIRDWELRYSNLFREEVVKRLPQKIKMLERETPPPTTPYVPRPTTPYVKRVYDLKLLKGQKHARYRRTYGWRYLGEEDLVRKDDEILDTGHEYVRRETYDGDRLKGCDRSKIRYFKVIRGNPVPPPKLAMATPAMAPDTIAINVAPSSIPALQLESINGEKYVRADLIEHQLRDDIELPQIYSNLDQKRFARDIMMALEAKAVFSYLLPRIRVVDAQQILELRRKVADTREGFAMHLQKLSKGLEEHAKEGTSIEEVAKYAKSLIETELIPDYREFRRQLESIRAHNWKNFLDPVCKVAEIDAAPWTPKFWGLLMKSLGFAVLETTQEQQEKLTNKYQAFKFMSQVETASIRHPTL